MRSAIGCSASCCPSPSQGAPSVADWLPERVYPTRLYARANSDLVRHRCSYRAGSSRPSVADPIRRPAADLSEELVVFLSGLQDPNRETSRQQLDGRPRHRRRANNLSPQNNRRRAIPRAKTNRGDGAKVRWSGCPHEQAATRKVARNSCCSRFLDLEAYRDLRRPATICSPLRALLFRDHQGPSYSEITNGGGPGLESRHTRVPIREEHRPARSPEMRSSARPRRL
jgi:hypothetical protein